MIAFGQPGYTGLPDQQRSIIYVGNMRRDGKISCVYVFPISGRKITKLLTRDQLAAETIKGDYDVRR